ncbi:aminotransferase [Vibrio sp. MACH09]|uniref:DegT/DnrJ/EryC1/StrS family aminotransferase n=1 Tax=Vibrio sp. MACH09 TaxID=3025122 RepID=UPI00278FC146|nr:DegT/DnrJ/EryC1/StrS aminotransferase family protein [Vibrio sp. MACH09]GLO59662.1 aminotransferase [Vibrio sp. MACH09]
MLEVSISPWPSYTREEIEAVTKVLQSNRVNYWTGDECRKFESEFAEWSGSLFAIAVANGTLALDIALKALNIEQGDEVITTPRTFLASTSSIVNAGANPVFADVDLNSQNITAKTIEAKITPNTKAVIVVHLAGMPAEMTDIMELSAKYGFYVIEDCAQAHGALYKGKSVGTIGHIGAWSFCQDKIMTTGGEGGMVTTNDQELWSKMWAYKDHGKSYDAVYNQEHAAGFRWLHDTFGSNFRMTEMQAAIGRIQIKKMHDWSERRRKIGNDIDNSLMHIKAVRIVVVPEYMRHAEYKHYFFIRPEHLKLGWSRDKIIHEINARGIPVYQGSCPEVYLEKAFDDTGWRPTKRLINAKKLGETSIMCLVHPTLSESEVKLMCYTMNEILNMASK